MPLFPTRSKRRGRSCADTPAGRPLTRAGTHPAGGFTFLELLIALAILGSTFTILLAAHTSASRMAAEARQRFTATALAREKMTAVEVEGLPVFGKDAGDFGGDFPGFRWELEVNEIPSQPLQELKEVILRVLWSEGRNARTLQLVFFHMVKETG